MAASEEQFQRHRREFRETQKARIQEETDRELSDEELERRLDEGMDEARERLYREARADLDERFGDGEGTNEAFEEPAHTLVTAWTDVLTGTLTYDEYVATVETAKGDLGDAFVATSESKVDEEMPDTVDMTDEMDGEAEESLEIAREIVSMVNALVFVLLSLALLVGGLIAWGHSRVRSGADDGCPRHGGRGIGVVGSQIAIGPVEARLPAESPEMARFLTGVAAGVFGALTWQSALLLVGGIGLIAVGIAIRRGLLLNGAD